MVRFSGSVRLRPVRVAFLVPPNDLPLVARVAQLSTCLWGGRYNPIIPFFETGGERWVRPHRSVNALDIARGYIDFFEPDTLVEAAPGMAEKLGWQSEPRMLGLPRVIALSDFYEVDDRGRVQFAAGIDIAEPMRELYDTDYKYERRHKFPFADIEQSPGNAFFDVFGGRYPTDERLSYIAQEFREIFSAEKLPATADTAMQLLKGQYAAPLWVTRHGLEESSGRGFSADENFCVFDPTDPGDVIDFWNTRLVERRVVPINVEWLAEHREFLREGITAINQPIPGNSFGTKFHSAVQFGNSIPDDRSRELAKALLTDLPDGSFHLTRPSSIWHGVRRGRNGRKTKIIATGKPVSFDEEIGANRYVKLPAPAPSFLNASRHYAQARWVNLVSVADFYQRPDPAIVYPSNLWSPEFPRLGNSRLRIGREGWVLQQEHDIGYSLFELQDGRSSIVAWLKTQGIEATPSEEGQVSSRVIATAETLLACGMFADVKTLHLLNGMAESHTEVSRHGRRAIKSTPDRTKHVQQIRQHFVDREKRSFGYWNKLDHFLDRSVFRAGLSVQCPVCSYHNWFAVDDLSYKPTCTRCLNSFDFSQAPQDLRQVEWYYRVTGPFAAPDYARGAYAVALTLRTIGPHNYCNITWSTGLRLDSLNCEIDFVAWYQSSRMISTDERDEPLLILGEAKSFGVGSVNDEAIDSLKKVAERFPGAVMVVSTLRVIDDYSLAEIARLRHLALWGRRQTFEGKPINPLIVLTGTELFAQHFISNAWKEIDGKEVHASIDLRDPHTLAEMTQHRYLGLQSHWDRPVENRLPESMRRVLSAIRSRASGT